MMGVDQAVCSACRQGLSGQGRSGIIKQFSEEFPNITIYATDVQLLAGEIAKQELLVIKGGKMLIKL